MMATKDIDFSSKGYLNMQLLRFTTAGSVDDGKSTLIGRLLYDSKSLFEDQLDAVKRASVQKGSEHLNLALFTDGLRAEREQGITIDVAYRYFATPNRKFIIADTPGHIQYTRNMVTGASTANAAIILIDARNGVIEQTYRHAYIAYLLGIPHIVVCINKMDLLDYSQEVFEKIKADFNAFVAKVLPGEDLRFIPISALKGDNVVKPSQKMEWYNNSTLLETLETIPIDQDHDMIHQRFPVQYVIRPESDKYHDYRGYAGRIAGGIFHPGDDVMVLPAGIKTKIRQIDTFNGPLDEAFPPMSVTLLLDDDIDISRGNMIAGAGDLPKAASEFDSMICWMNPKPMQFNGKYALKNNSRDVRCVIDKIDFVLNINTLEQIAGRTSLAMNEIGRIHLRTTKPLFFDPYTVNRQTGSIILIDEATNETVAAGMIL
ncbi:MAG: GTP-binding protein [Bacteroidetes bacterium]|nr:GTP-binding protein [Bacteroidota bacterium]